MPRDPFGNYRDLPADGNPRSRTIIPSETVKCPWCGAKPGERCFSENSSRSKPHRVRRVALELSLGNEHVRPRLEKMLEQLTRRENNRLKKTEGESSDD